MSNVFYVYILFDWLGIPRYVGKGKGKRDQSHERYSDPKNPAKNEFIEQTWIVLGELPKIRVRENLSEREAFEIESTLIKAIGRTNVRRGPLTNLTDGGEGPSGLRHRSDSKLIMGIITSRRYAAMTPEQRREHGRISKAGRTSEDYSRAAIKSNANRDLIAMGKKIRQKQLATWARRSAKERDIIIRKGIVSQTPEQRSMKAREGGRVAMSLRTKEQNRAHGAKISATIWINDGMTELRPSRELAIPEGWKRGRLPKRVDESELDASGAAED